MADKPKHTRFAPPVQAELKVPEKTLGPNTQTDFTCKVVDLTTAGADILINQQLEKGLVVELRLVYPELKEGLDLKGIVMRAIAPPPVAGATDWIIGIDFKKTTMEALNLLDKWRRHAISTMVRTRNEAKRRDFGVSGPGPDGMS
jgi:hypothetical protein